MTKQLKSAASSALWGVLLLLGAFWFWHESAGNPFDDLALIRRGDTAPGFIVDAWEDDEGRHCFHGVFYTFRLPDGRKFTQRTKDRSGRLRADLHDLTEPVPIEVEYLPDNPTVSRIKGEGSPTVFDWVWRKLGLGSLLLALLLAPGFIMLRIGIREFIQYRRTPNERAAIADYSEAIRLEPDTAEAYRDRALAYERKGQYDKAIADYSEAIRLKPDYAEAYHGRGRAYYWEDEHDKAIADYSEAIRLKPAWARHYLDRGRAYESKGQHEKASADFSEAIRLRPELADEIRRA